MRNFKLANLFKVLYLVGFILVGCATGEKWTQIEEGMTKNDVREAIGKQDEIEKKSNGWSVHWYKNRLISGWSWDKTDYFVIYDPNGRVDTYGHGAVDTRTSERIAIWSATQNANPRSPSNVSCKTTKYGNSVVTDCKEK
jgi:hypothetical protein